MSKYKTAFDVVDRLIDRAAERGYDLISPTFFGDSVIVSAYPQDKEEVPGPNPPELTQLGFNHQHYFRYKDCVQQTLRSTVYGEDGGRVVIDMVVAIGPVSKYGGLLISNDDYTA